MKVGWLADRSPYMGGAEMTAAEFRVAAPEGVTIWDCPPGKVIPRLDRYVIHNCVSYSPEDLTVEPAFKYWHDVGPHISQEQHEALAPAEFICTSPLQAEHMGFVVDVGGPKGLVTCEFIPPGVNLEPFRKAAENAPERLGAVAVGPWMNPAKNPQRAAEWAEGNGGIDFYGDGPFAPLGAEPVDHEDLPEILARYKHFVHLPSEIEPFGRSTVEAHAAGCELVLNRNVGARYWLEEAPEKLESAAQDFWELVLSPP